MLIDWFRNRRQQAILAEPFPPNWEETIRSGVLHASQLSEEQRKKLRRLVQVFVAEKHWEGCRGLALTDEMKVIIAAQACLLVVGRPEDDCFDHVLSVLVYPTGYIAKNVELTRAGVVIEGEQARLGEAWWRGPVVLSWEDARDGGRLETPGHNLVLHEFAHQLDMMNGRTVDGTPPLQSRAQVARWVEVMEPEYQQLIQSCDAGRPNCIDCYGATNRAEFFAVVTETFFERPRSLRRRHAALYELFKDYYRLDPAQWTWEHAPETG